MHLKHYSATNPQIISTFCDRALLLDHGRFVMDGPAEDIAAAYVERLTHAER